MRRRRPAWAPSTRPTEVIRVPCDAVRRIESVAWGRERLGDGIEFIEDGNDEPESV